MFYPALAMTTAVWLITAPLMEVEVGPMAVLSIVAGCAAWVLASLGYWSRTSQRSLAVLGALLGAANILLPSTVGTEAACAVSSMVLIIAGVAPMSAKRGVPARTARVATAIAR